MGPVRNFRETQMTYRIAVVVGSLRRDSFNAKLAAALAGLAPQQLEFVPVRIDDLPLYNQDNDDKPPETVRRLKSEIAAAQGVLFVTPEYNRSVPGVLKNAIDHASRPYGQSVWGGKPAAVIGVSIGAIGTALAQQHLRNILAYLDMPTLGQPEMFIQNKPGLFTEQGGIGPDDTREFLLKFLERFAEWVKHHADRVANK
jgi:chromate reductase, NAD(P)H dehydrogenase (quinone)